MVRNGAVLVVVSVVESGSLNCSGCYWHRYRHVASLVRAIGVLFVGSYRFSEGCLESTVNSITEAPMLLPLNSGDN